jgi:predicted nucleotidyltransferase
MAGQTVNNDILAVKDIILETVDCEKIYLFGSYAYGSPQEDSDYDFYVVLKDDAKNPLLVMEDISWNIAKTHAIKMPVDILAGYNTTFINHSKLPTMERKIVREGILLYGNNP